MADADADDALEEPRRRPWRAVLVLLAIGFVGGIVFGGWAIGRWEPVDAFVRARFGKPAFVPAPISARPIRIVAVPAPPPADAATAVALGGRVEALAERIDAIDQRARAATGDADRAEGLLVAFAARRALDRGVDLGYIEGLLRGRFGANQPQAVAAIIAAARQPVTLAALEAGLEQVAPALTGHAPDESWWTTARRELAGMIVVRRAGVPPTDPNDRIDRARRALESGQADVALAEIARIPGNDAAMPWMTAARRYIGSRSALDRIETAALLEPDRSGSPPADADLTPAPALPVPIAKPAVKPATVAKPVGKPVVKPNPRKDAKPDVGPAAKSKDQAPKMRR